MKVGEKECTRVVSGAIYQRAGVRASQEGNGCANETRGDHRANEPASGWVRKQSRREREQGVCPRAQRGRHESKRRGWLLKSSSRSSLSAAIRARPPTDPDRARTPCRPASRARTSDRHHLPRGQHSSLRLDHFDSVHILNKFFHLTSVLLKYRSIDLNPC